MNVQIDTSRFGYVYRTTNLINGKSYVGKHRIKPSENWLSYLGSGTAIVRAIRKYGKEQFSKELLTYADSENELSELEAQLINKEIGINGRGLYNILSAPSEALSISTVSILNGHDVLSMYFDNLMSTAEIADVIGVSQPTVYAYLRKFKETDSRFSQVVQGRSIGPSRNLGKKASQRSIDFLRTRMNANKKVNCERCGDIFSEGGTIATHQKSCDGIPWPHCSVCDKRLSKRGAILCADHKRSNRMAEASI